MTLDSHWFSEICEEGGSAFSLRIRQKLHEEQTEYQLIEIYQTEHFGKLMVIDGFVMLTDRDNFIYHEMMSHPALFSHPDPRRVAIIGGGDCGTLREVLRHGNVEEATQIEIDERVTRLSEQYFPQLCESNGDRRAHFCFDDGIEWMRTRAPGSLDVIIIDSTDPIGPAKGLFGEDFYRLCEKALGQEGVLVQQSESPLYHMHILEPMQTAMRTAGFNAIGTLHYPQAVYPSGWWSSTLASKSAQLGFREADARNKDFTTEYYNADLHRAAQVAPEFVRRALGT